REEGLARFECLQPRYNLLDRADFETEIAGLCEREQLGVVTYSSLASGFLTGKYRSTADLAKSPRGARMAPRLGARGIRVLAALDDVALRLGTAPASVALAWVMQRPVVTAPIASATSVAQLTELLAAAELRLDRAAVEQLDRASEPLPG
ncbi:MAG: aldo/keto reductase, partial [Thermoplasmata archaeon]|nr:aldo/keto reductase [Thermoplasmata archaeon]